MPFQKCLFHVVTKTTILFRIRTLRSRCLHGRYRLLALKQPLALPYGHDMVHSECHDILQITTCTVSFYQVLLRMLPNPTSAVNVCVYVSEFEVLPCYNSHSAQVLEFFFLSD